MLSQSSWIHAERPFCSLRALQPIVSSSVPAGRRSEKQALLLTCAADTIMIVSKKLCFLTKFQPPRAPSILSDRPKSQGNEDHQSLEKNYAYAVLSLWKMCSWYSWRGFLTQNPAFIMAFEIFHYLAIRYITLGRCPKALVFQERFHIAFVFVVTQNDPGAISPDVCKWAFELVLTLFMVMTP